jgi:hypothetical protein
MTKWVYLLTTSPKFPDPRGEAKALCEVKAQKQIPWLLLADTKAPPMTTARPGDDLFLCVREEGTQLLKVATAKIWQPARDRATPQSVLAVYGDTTARRFIPLESIELHDPPTPLTELTEAEMVTFKKGQAYARKVPER